MATYQLDDLYRITGNNPDAVLRLLHIFIKDTPSQVELLKQSLAQDDNQAMGEFIHKLIPKARHMGLTDVSERMRNIKSEIDRQEAPSVAEVKDIIHIFEGLFQHIQEDILRLEGQKS